MLKSRIIREASAFFALFSASAAIAFLADYPRYPGFAALLAVALTAITISVVAGYIADSPIKHAIAVFSGLFAGSAYILGAVGRWHYVIFLCCVVALLLLGYIFFEINFGDDGEEEA